jgi:apolipoprotein N-acyltransferase
VCAASKQALAAVISWLKLIWPWFAAALSGLALALCFPNWNQSWLAWVALIPLICAVWFSGRHRRRRWLYQVGLGYCAGLVFFWLTFRWLITVTGLGWFVLAFYLALYFAFWAWFVGSIACHGDVPRIPDASTSSWTSSRRSLWISFLGASAWVAQEALRGILFTGFGWNGLGVALHDQIFLIQITSLAGVAGLSFLVAFCNMMIVITARRIVIEAGRAKWRPHYDFTLTSVILIGTFAHGVKTLQKHHDTVPLRVASVQANIPQHQKFDRNFEGRIFETYIRLTETAAGLNPDLLLWPEAATPLPVFLDRLNYDFVLSAASMGPYNFLLGSIDYENDDGFNVAVMFTSPEAEPQIYRKMHLVPFGEYIPFRHSFPLFAWIAGNLVPGDFRAGSDFTLLEMKDPEFKVAALICFEDTLGDLTRRFVQRGADILVNVTNDGWFLRSEAAEQHLANAVFRAAENRRPLLRSANTGVTAFIDEFGNVRMSLRDSNGGHFIEGVLFGELEVPRNAPQTFYTRHGELFAIGCSSVTMLAMTFGAFQNWRRAR